MGSMPQKDERGRMIEENMGLVIRLLAQGYTHREIGERMGGASANNVSAWVARARKFLRSDQTIKDLGDAI